MTMARAHLVDVSVTRWYHCVTRCVRRALLLGEAPWNRKQWIERQARRTCENLCRRLQRVLSAWTGPRRRSWARSAPERLHRDRFGSG
jgi:hypothetical protein